jgi:hypothetical protein
MPWRQTIIAPAAVQKAQTAQTIKNAGVQAVFRNDVRAETAAQDFCGKMTSVFSMLELLDIGMA